MALVTALAMSLWAAPAEADAPSRTNDELIAEQTLTNRLNDARQDPGKYGYPGIDSRNPVASKWDLQDLSRSWSDKMARDGRLSNAPRERACCWTEVTDVIGHLPNVDSYSSVDRAARAMFQEQLMDHEARRFDLMTPQFDHVGFGVKIDNSGNMWVTAVLRKYNGDPLPEEPDPEPTEPATPEDGACPPEHVRDAGFTDVTAYRHEINCLAGWDITHGVGDGSRYNPSGSVTRAQMASFLSRAIINSGGSLPPASSNFSDVSGPHASAINRLAAAGIAGGYPDGAYRPDARITRGQMATFLTRSYEHRFDLTMDEAPDSGLSDVPGDTHEDRINQAVDQGWAHGYGDGTYAPGSSVRRDHMALFITRWLDTLTAEHGVAFPG